MIYNGQTWELTNQERADNELKACAEMVRTHPLNEYWQNRYFTAIVEWYRCHDAELEKLRAWFRSVSEKSLNDMTSGEQAQWFAGVQPIEF